MRVSREKAQRNRVTIVNVAAEMFREKGFNGVGIADIMKNAGLTHGGFYGQFQSKEQLEAEASEAAMTATRQNWRAALADESGEPLRALADFYLTENHRDHPKSGCLFAALAADTARSGPQVKKALSEGLSDHLELIEQSLIREGEAPKVARQKALAALSMLVGALSLSRAVNNQALSKEILDAARALIFKTGG